MDDMPRRVTMVAEIADEMERVLSEFERLLDELDEMVRIAIMAAKAYESMHPEVS